MSSIPRGSPILLALASACIDVSPEYTCRSEDDCVLDGARGRCEPSGSCSFADANCGPDGRRYHGRSGARSNVCIVPLGGGLALPPVDLKQQRDTTRSTCAPAGARDAFVELLSPGPQILFVDTPTPTNGARTRLAVRAGFCPGAPGPELGCTPADDCGPIAYNRLMVGIGPGPHCLVVEEADPAADTGAVQLRLYPAGRAAGRVLAEPSVSLPSNLPEANTCNQPPHPDAMCNPVPGNSTAAFAMPICPGEAQLSVTVDPEDAPGMLDAVLSIRRSVPGGPAVACKNDRSDQMPEMVSSMPINGPELYWILVSGAGPTCGPFLFSHNRVGP